MTRLRRSSRSSESSRWYFSWERRRRSSSRSAAESFLPARRLVELAVAKLRGQLEPVVQVACHAQLAREDGGDLLVGQLHRAAERLVVRLRREAGAEARQKRLQLARLQVEELETLHLREHHPLLDGLAQRGGEDGTVQRHAGGRGALRQISRTRVSAATSERVMECASTTATTSSSRRRSAAREGGARQSKSARDAILTGGW